MKHLKNQTIVITGATSGLGLALATEAVKNGADLILISRSETALEGVLTQLSKLKRENATIQYVAADLAQPERIDTAIRFLENLGRPIDVFINNAGSGLSGEFVNNDWSHVENMCRLNMMAVARLSHWAGKTMKERRRGRIINISALAALQAQPYFGIYGATRSFITNLSMAMHQELKKYRVHVSCVHPGSIKSNFETSARINNTLAIRLLGHMPAEKVAKKILTKLHKNQAFSVVGLPYKMIYWSSLITPKSLGLKLMAVLFKQ